MPLPTWLKTRSIIFWPWDSTTQTYPFYCLTTKRPGRSRTRSTPRLLKGTATGATAGGVIGGTLGLLAGIGMLAIPGVGPLIAAGPIVAALAGVGAGGALGGIVGALVGMGIPEYEAKRYEGAVKDGGTLLSVHCETSENATIATKALRDTGARDIASSGEESSGGETVVVDETGDELQRAYRRDSGSRSTAEPVDELENAYLRK